MLREILPFETYPCKTHLNIMSILDGVLLGYSVVVVTMVSGCHDNPTNRWTGVHRCAEELARDSLGVDDIQVCTHTHTHTHTYTRTHTPHAHKLEDSNSRSEVHKILTGP